MNTDQARRLITLHDNADRALANLRNAGAMSTDDPRATELLEDAGDAYAEATAALFAEQLALRASDAASEAEFRSEPAPLPEGFEAGKAYSIKAQDSSGSGFVRGGVDGIAEGNVALRLTTTGVWRTEKFPKGATISVPTDCLVPVDATSAPQKPAEDSPEDQADPSA